MHDRQFEDQMNDWRMKDENMIPFKTPFGLVFVKSIGEVCNDTPCSWTDVLEEVTSVEVHVKNNG